MGLALLTLVPLHFGSIFCITVGSGRVEEDVGNDVKHTTELLASIRHLTFFVRDVVLAFGHFALPTTRCELKFGGRGRASGRETWLE